uniref:Uncharacterized protein n=1 Tax=Timema poppense TaxID=170557 RepID=A0A7R9GTM4_TIMPO|nr:unnamed protein product [Timema poppensis]
MKKLVNERDHARASTEQSPGLGHPSQQGGGEPSNGPSVGLNQTGVTATLQCVFSHCNGRVRRTQSRLLSMTFDTTLLRLKFYNVSRPGGGVRYPRSPTH